MMRAGKFGLLVVIAVVAGIGACEAVLHSPFWRDLIGKCCGRGGLVALVHGHGIYESDVQREMTAQRYLHGQKSLDLPGERLTQQLIADENLRHISAREVSADLPRQFELLRDQFGDEKAYSKRLHDVGLTETRLRDSLGDNLRGRKWIGQKIPAQATSDEQTLRKYYDQHQTAFMLPLRLRVSHIFLAAPPGTSPDVVEMKKTWIESLAQRFRAGESFGALAWEASEDEATKPHEGDLGFISESRVPADFFAVVSRMKVGELARVIRTKLGFHLVFVTDVKPARQLPFDEARPEILAAFDNSARREAVQNLATQLSGSSALRARWFWN